MPPYKLLVDFELRMDYPLKRFLNPREVIRGVPFALRLKVVNIGTEVFPGGRMGRFNIAQAEFAGMRKEAVFGEEGNIGKLQPEEPWKPIDLALFIEWEGLVRISLSISAEDGQGVESYQAREVPVRGGEWLNFFYSVNRERILILEALEKLTSKLEGSK